MKKIIAVVLAILMILTCVACGSKESSQPNVDKQEQEKLSLLVEDDSEYVAMSMSELYEKAKLEGGKLVIYSETSSATKTVAKFQEEYPGIEIECSKVKATDIASKVPLEADSGNASYDLIISSDASGSFYKTWYTKGYGVAYYPSVIKDDLLQDYISFGLPITLEADLWYYNTAMYKDGCPINNIWDIVEMDANGNSKYVLYTFPLTNINNAALFSNYALHSDEMAAAYKAKYGKDIEFTYDATDLGVEENNAGLEWLYRFIQCKHVLINDADELLSSLVNSTDPALCCTSSLKLGDAIEAGMDIDFVDSLNPFNGFVRAKYVYVNPKSDNPAAARLFTLYSLGGEDSTGDGYGPFVNRKGCYSTRTSFDDLKNNDVEISELNVKPADLDYVFDNYLDVQDFFAYYSDALGAAQ